MSYEKRENDPSLLRWLYDTPMNSSLRRAREMQCLSQRDLAAAAGVNVATICRIENGDCKPHPSTVRKLAQALQIKPQDLLSTQPRLMA